MNESTKEWIRIAASVEELFSAGKQIIETKAGNKDICVGRYKDELYAFPVKCPHASGRLSEGFIDALGNIVCPLHRYKFCMKNGRNVSGEGYYLKHWPVEIRDDGIYVQLEEKGFLSFFH